MDPDIVTFAQVMTVIAGFVGFVTVVGVGAFAVVRRQVRRPAARLDPALEHQLAQLQQSVDAIAIEVERISEAQRFSSRLLADRGERGEHAGQTPVR